MATTGCLPEFQPGCVYLVKSHPLSFWWLCDRLPQTKVLWKPSNETYYQIEQSTFELPTNYFVVPKDYSEIPRNLQLEEHSLFLLLGDGKGELSKVAQKAYKSLSGGSYIQVDLNLDFAQDDKIKKALAKVDEEVGQTLLAELPTPQRLLYQLRQPNPLDYDLPEITTRRATQLIEALPTAEGLKLWRSLSKQELYSLFLTQERSSCGMYLILSAGSRQLKQYGLCPALWSYLDLFLEHLLPRYQAKPEYVLRSFATWVYLTSTLYASSTHRGLHQRQWKTGNFWSFDPSPQAYQQLELMLGLSTLEFYQNV